MTSEEKKEEYVKKYGQQVINEVNYILGPKFLKHKEVFIRCVDHVFADWLNEQYNNDTTVMYAIEKRFYKK